MKDQIALQLNFLLALLRNDIHQKSSGSEFCLVGKKISNMTGWPQSVSCQYNPEMNAKYAEGNISA